MPPGDFKDLLSGSIEEGLRHSSERLYAMGRGIWVPKEGDRRLIIPGIALPSRLRGKRSSPAPIDFINTFVSLTDYLEPEKAPGGSVEALMQQIVGSLNPRMLLTQLTFLNHLANRPGQVKRLVHGYSNLLRPDLKDAFEDALRKDSEESGEAHLVSRQGMLAAARVVLGAGTWERDGLEEPTLATSILLVHAASAGLIEMRDSGEYLGKIPAEPLMEMVRNGLFNENDDYYSVLDRALRVWEDLVTRPMRTPLRPQDRQPAPAKSSNLEPEEPRAVDRAAEERFTYAPQPPDAPDPLPEEGENGATEPTAREETRLLTDAPEHDAPVEPEEAAHNRHATPAAAPNPYDAALALNACLPDGEKVERDLLLTEAARKLGYPKLIRKVRRALNQALNAEHNAGRLRTDWERVWRPKK